MLDNLRSILESWLSRLILTFLKHVKTSILSSDDLIRRAVNSPDKFRSLAFLGIFEVVQARYEKKLNQEGAVDFEDQINDAAGHIRNHRSFARYRYILVDEFSRHIRQPNGHAHRTQETRNRLLSGRRRLAINLPFCRQ